MCLQIHHCRRFIDDTPTEIRDRKTEIIIRIKSSQITASEESSESVRGREISRLQRSISSVSCQDMLEQFRIESDERYDTYVLAQAFNFGMVLFIKRGSIGTYLTLRI